jgi:hypothetical protein
MSLKGSLRNAPCPCGSGKKYKKCCLPKEQIKTANLLWNKLRQTDDQLVPKLLQFADHAFGEDAVSEAWDEFAGLHENIEFELDSIHNQAFIPWFLYNWNVQDRLLDSNQTGRMTIAGEYLAQRQKLLSDMESRFITLNCSSAFSFYEIMNCDQGTGYTLKDILSGYTLYVTEKSGSQKTQPGDILYAKAIQYDDIGLLCGSGAVIIPPIYKPTIIDLRASMRSGIDVIGKNDMHEWDDEIRDVYMEIFDHLHTPPEIRNMDGDPFLFHNMIFKIDSPITAFDVLKGLAGGIPENELLETAEFDDQNNLVKIDFPWVKASGKKAFGEEFPTLGQINIENDELKVFVNSEKRAKKIRKEIEKRLGNQVKFLSMEVKTLEKAKDELDLKEEKKPEIEQTPEMQEVMHRILESHWEKWVDENIPALGGITPRQAVKDNDGREKVIALLDDFERREKNLSDNESQIEYIQNVRKQLGLTRELE